jgi:hypothetical protein
MLVPLDYAIASSDKFGRNRLSIDAAFTDPSSDVQLAR